MKKYNIVCLSNQLWDFPNWTNKRHVMSRLSKLGHNVLFVDPPINFGKVLLAQVKRKLWSIRRFFTQCKVSDCGAAVYTPINLLPLSFITSKFHIKKIRKLSRKQFTNKNETILWIYHVQLADLKSYLDRLEYDILVYDCVDNYGAIPEEKAFFRTNIFGEELKVQERSLTTRANIVFASAPGLVDKLKNYNKKVYYTPNVGDYKRFKDVVNFKDQVPEDLKSIPRPRVGMLGSLDEYKFDAKLVREVASDNLEVSFVLIGQIALKDKNATINDLGLGGLKNVYYLGAKPYENKHLYMAGFDAEMIPYKLNDYTVGGCFPVKFHDSLAAGLPVIVTNLPAYAPFEEVSYISKTPEEFSKNIRKALDEDTPARIKARQAVAKENDWEGKVKKMLELIEYDE